MARLLLLAVVAVGLYLVLRPLPVTPLDIVTLARRYLGTPYCWGGESPACFDCSGFVQFVWGQMGKTLPRTADMQFYALPVVVGPILPGDLMFFQFETYVDHVGLATGVGDYMIDASLQAGKVAERSISALGWGPYYVGAGRPEG